jgi:ribosomal protein L34E
MSKKDNCQACTFMLHGVKTRKSIPHTCGRTNEQLSELKRNYEIRRNKSLTQT